MKDKDEQTALIGMAIGAAVISLVATQKQINQGSIVDELVRLGRQKGDGVEDEVFVQAARRSERHLANRDPAWQSIYPFHHSFHSWIAAASGDCCFPKASRTGAFLS